MAQPPLSEQEEFELLSLERARASSKKPQLQSKPPPGFAEEIERSLYGSAGTALKGFLSGGPLGAAASLTHRGVEEAGKLVEDTAYKAGGGVTDIASKAGYSPEVAAAAGYGTNVGIQAIPVVAGSIANQAAPLMKRAGRWLMTSAIKPPAGMRKSGEAAKAIETMLQKGISPTSSGLRATREAVDDLEIAIQTKLENSGATVSKIATAKAALKSASDDVKHNLNRVENEKDIQDALDKFLNHPELKQYADDFPVAVANRLKQSFYGEVGQKGYVPGTELTAFDKTEKSLAGSLRQQVLKAEPSARPDLGEQSKMMQVAKMLKERVGAAESQNVVGLGGAMSQSYLRLMIFWADRYPWFKGWLARALYTGATPVTAGVGVAAGLTAAEEIQEKIEKRNK